MEPNPVRLRLPSRLPGPLAEAAQFLVAAPRDRSADLLDAVLRHAPLVLFVLDADGRVISSTGKPTQLLRERRGPIVGRRVTDVYAEVPEVVGFVERALGGEAFTATARVEGRTFECSYAPAVDRLGQVERVIGVALDVTERARVERELADAERELRTTRVALEAAASGTGPADDPSARVLVVSDQPLSRLALATLLERAGGVEAPTADGLDEALAQIRRDPPDALVLAVADATEALVRLGAERPGLPLVVVERRDLEAVGPALLRLGANGLLAPDDAPQHLVAALRAVLGGTGYLPPALAHAMAVSGPANRVLSERERQTVMLYGRGLTRAEIAAEMHVTGGR
ncbi:MAG: PAS domain-containing protein [Bacteroidota bacterium]